MRTPNTTFDVYVDDRLPPATPDAAGQAGYLYDVWPRGNEVSEGDRTFFFTSILEAAPRSGFRTATGRATGFSSSSANAASPATTSSAPIS
jgi:hypothetical protein